MFDNLFFEYVNPAKIKGINVISIDKAKVLPVSNFKLEKLINPSNE